MTEKTLTKGTTIIHRAKSFTDATQAVAYLQEIYETSCSKIYKSYEELLNGNLAAGSPSDACYPYLGVTIESSRLAIDARYSYGVLDSSGFFGTTMTNPLLFKDYYLEQIALLIKRYKTSAIVGLSNWRIPVSFVVDYSTAPLTQDQVDALKIGFVLPDLKRIDDHIVNHTYKHDPLEPKPLSLFSGERVDFSLQRLFHYTGTSPEHFQGFILLTNYQRYIEEFREYAFGLMRTGEGNYEAFVEPGDCIHLHGGKKIGEVPSHLPQMPAYHLKYPDKMGITFVNIGVGPTNAKNITDHLAVLRPHCWIMLGHCAGLKRSQELGDYVLAHGYVREDSVLDDDLPLWVPVPAIAEIQIALQEAVGVLTGLKDRDAKRRMRTGTVFTTGNRNWELRSDEIYERFNQSRAIALDMESATIAANGLRFRVPYGTLLCVSDKPIHGEIKLRGMANNFYNQRVNQHLKIGLEAIRILRERGIHALHSRKLRGFDEPAFR